MRSESKPNELSHWSAGISKSRTEKLVPLCAAVIAMVSAISSAVSAYQSRVQVGMSRAFEQDRVQSALLKDYIMSAERFCASFVSDPLLSEYDIREVDSADVPIDFNGIVRTRTDDKTRKQITVLVSFAGVGRPIMPKYPKSQTDLESDFRLKATMLQYALSETKSYPNRLIDLIGAQFDADERDLRSDQTGNPLLTAYRLKYLRLTCQSAIGRTLHLFNERSGAHALFE